MKPIILAVVIVAIALLTSCSGELAIVKPYEREFFAEDRMVFSPMEGRSEWSSHIFLVKEAAQGGEGSFQGGCGCR